MGYAVAACLRILFIVLNFLCALLSLGLLGLALYLYFSQSFHQVTDYSYRLPLFLYILMGLGGVTALVSALGVFGGVCFSPALLGLYAFIFCVLLVGEISGILFIYIMKGQVVDFVKRGLMDLLNNYRANSSRGMGTALDFVQTVFHCCGANGFVDFLNPLLPASCCASGSPDRCNAVWVLLHKVPGCKTRFVDIIYDQHIAITLSAFAGLALIELMLIITSSYLCHFIRRQARY